MKWIFKFGNQIIREVDLPCSKSIEKNQGKVVQPQQQFTIKEAEKDHKTRNTQMVKGSSSSTTTCLLCGRDFPSKQSLFGHMKSHPQRILRGIQSPPPIKPDDMLLSDDQEIKDAVDGLLMLKMGVSENGVSINKQINREKEGINKSKRKKKMTLESSFKKLKIDQDRNCSISRNDFVQSIQLEQLQDHHCSSGSTITMNSFVGLGVPVNSMEMGLTEKRVKEELMASLPESSSVEEVINSETKTEKKKKIWIDLNELPDDLDED